MALRPQTVRANSNLHMSWNSDYLSGGISVECHISHAPDDSTERNLTTRPRFFGSTEWVTLAILSLSFRNKLDHKMS